MFLKQGLILFTLCSFMAEAWRGKGNGKGRGPRKPHNWGNMTTDQVDQFKKSLGGRTNVDRFMGALDRFNEDGVKLVQPSDEEKADMLERIKHIRKHKWSPKSQKEGDSLSEINQNAGVASSLYGGDMALIDPQVDALLGDFVDDDDESTGESRKKRQAYYTTSYPAMLWTDNTVYYYFDSSLSAAAITVSRIAIAFWQNSTCINFVEKQDAPNRIRFFMGTGCYSNIGMIKGQQDLSLGTGCEHFSVVAHELGHALGFFHEQSRHDRDTAVTIDTANVDAAKVSNYRKETVDSNNNYGMPYDYGSVMQYDQNAFSSNGQVAMVAKVIPYQDTMGGPTVSFYDISMMNEYYQCKKKCTTGATCMNGGIRNSRNCNTCICPSGWAGTTCTERPTGCGATLTATATAQTQTFTLGTMGAAMQNVMETCNYMIKAPIGNKVEVVLKTMTGVIACTPGCPFKSIEFKAMSDHRYTGARACCSDDQGMTVVSEAHLMPVIGYERLQSTTYTFTYRYVSASTPSTVKVSQIASTAATYDASGDPIVVETKTTAKPVVLLTTTRSTAPNKTACADLNANCATWVSNGFCSSTGYTLQQKKDYCPGSCNLCTTTITSTITCTDNTKAGLNR
ncbi:unnamed protein product, partial [Mesorhabditis belari]|uniref:Zinc metalloproteinase n=1 Tax=Mesorhabditis belari TaxID=2138241 RepID=A0AAF3EJ64_9BILA